MARPTRPGTRNTPGTRLRNRDYSNTTDLLGIRRFYRVRQRVLHMHGAMRGRAIRNHAVGSHLLIYYILSHLLLQPLVCPIRRRPAFASPRRQRPCPWANVNITLPALPRAGAVLLRHGSAPVQPRRGGRFRASLPLHLRGAALPSMRRRLHHNALLPPSRYPFT